MWQAGRPVFPSPSNHAHTNQPHPELPPCRVSAHSPPTLGEVRRAEVLWVGPHRRLQLLHIRPLAPHLKHALQGGGEGQ